MKRELARIPEIAAMLDMAPGSLRAYLSHYRHEPGAPKPVERGLYCVEEVVAFKRRRKEDGNLKRAAWFEQVKVFDSGSLESCTEVLGYLLPGVTREEVVAVAKLLPHTLKALAMLEATASGTNRMIFALPRRAGERGLLLAVLRQGSDVAGAAEQWDAILRTLPPHWRIAPKPLGDGPDAIEQTWDPCNWPATLNGYGPYILESHEPTQ